VLFDVPPTTLTVPDRAQTCPTIPGPPGKLNEVVDPLAHP